MGNMDQWIGKADKMFIEKELKQVLEMEFGNVLSNMKLPQERGDSKGIEEDVELVLLSGLENWLCLTGVFSDQGLKNCQRFHLSE